MSFLTSSSERVFGLPVGLLEMGFQEYIALTILGSCILSKEITLLIINVDTKYLGIVVMLYYEQY